MTKAADIHRLALYAALVDADLPAAWQATRALLDEGVPFESIVSEALAPAQREVGSRWAANDTGIADEHAATATMQQLITLLTASGQPTSDHLGEVVVACAEGDWHALAAQVVAASLHMRGWRAVYLGPSIPAIDLSIFVAERSPVAVALSCSHPRALIGAHHSIDAVRALGTPVIIGGRALGPNDTRARRLGANAWSDSAQAAGDIIERGVPDLPPARELPPAADRVAEVAGWVAEVAARAPDIGALPIPASELARELRDTVGVFASSLLLEEPSLVGDYVEWQTAMLDTRGVTPQQLATAIRAAAAHPAMPPGAGATLAEAAPSSL